MANRKDKLEYKRRENTTVMWKGKKYTAHVK